MKSRDGRTITTEDLPKATNSIPVTVGSSSSSTTLVVVTTLVVTLVVVVVAVVVVVVVICPYMSCIPTHTQTFNSLLLLRLLPSSHIHTSLMNWKLSLVVLFTALFLRP